MCNGSVEELEEVENKFCFCILGQLQGLDSAHNQIGQQWVAVVQSPWDKD